MRQPKTGLVYSTNKEYFEEQRRDEPSGSISGQNLHIRIEKNHRGGKTVTIISGFTGSEDEMTRLAKSLKQKCGAGGSVKDEEILIQGDFRERIKEELKKLGFKIKG